MRRLAFAALTVSALAGAAAADTLTLSDGRIIEGGLIGEDAAGLSFLDAKGKVRRFARGEVAAVDRASPVPKKIRKRLASKRASLRKKREREAYKLLSRYGSVKDERPALEAELMAFPEDVLVGVLGRGLENTYEAVRELCLKKLSAMKDNRRAVGYLVKSSLVSSEKDFRARSHAAALAIDDDLGRRYYDAVAASPNRAGRRMRALIYVEQIASLQSVPALISVVGSATAGIKAQLGKAKGFRQVPVRVGGNDVVIELPELELVAVSTTISIPALRALRSKSVAILKSMSGGVDYGDDAKAWQHWWSQQEAAKGAKKSS